MRKHGSTNCSALSKDAEPAAEPVTLTEAKAQCQVEHSADDALIAENIAAARQDAENAMNGALVTETWDIPTVLPREGLGNGVDWKGKPGGNRIASGCDRDRTLATQDAPPPAKYLPKKRGFLEITGGL